jgi:putative peptidoglycan lipid II flippase
MAILVYVLLLGWLQYRRFCREAIVRGVTLNDVPGMLLAALQMAIAAGIAIGAGWGVRVWLLGLLPGVHVIAISTRAVTLCAVGVGIYLMLLRLLGVHELTAIASWVTRKFKNG